VRPDRGRWASRLVAIVLLLAFAIFGGTAARIWWVARQDARPVSDAIVVLGASQFDGRPSPVFTARLDHALDLFERGVAPYVVTVGGSRPGDRFTEGAAGKRWLAAHGVPENRVVAIGEGSDTLQSMQAVRDVFGERGWARAVIVTDPWHTLRARAMARDLDIQAGGSPTRQGPAVRTRETELRYILRETLAYLYYEVFHRSSEIGPSAV
jgi:uncharacterized SAM-binding protein YcdF (DUF218 family)